MIWAIYLLKFCPEKERSQIKITIHVGSALQSIWKVDQHSYRVISAMKICVNFVLRTNLRPTCIVARLCTNVYLGKTDKVTIVTTASNLLLKACTLASNKNVFLMCVRSVQTQK